MKKVKKTEIVELQDKLLEYEKKALEYLEGWKRAQADFMNYRKEESERSQNSAKFAAQGMIIDLFDVVDNIDMVINQTPESIRKEHSGWVSGFEHVAKQFMDVLAKYGVERIKVEGEEFDPLKHEAIEGSHEEGNELEEIRAGYIMHNRVIRPARVKLVIK